MKPELKARYQAILMEEMKILRSERKASGKKFLSLPPKAEALAIRRASERFNKEVKTTQATAPRPPLVSVISESGMRYYVRSGEEAPLLDALNKTD